MKIKLIYKFFFIFLLFILGLGIAISYATYDNYKKTIEQKYYDQTESVAKLAVSIIDGDKVEEYGTTLKADDAYEIVLNNLNNIKEQTQCYYLYVMFPLSEKNGIYIYDTDPTEQQIEETGDSEAAPLGYEVSFIDESGVDNFTTAKEVMESGNISTELEVTRTMQGKTMQVLGSMYAPVKNSQGKTIAFVGVDVSMEDVEISTENAVKALVQIIIVLAVVFFILLLLIVEISIILPIRKLKGYAEKISEGIFGEQMRVRGHDEITEISSVFNRMSASISRHMEEISIINAAYHQYVPSEIFDILQKENVTDVKLGDQVKTTLSILSFDILNFNDIIKHMDSEEMFAFINRILGPVTLEVNASGGVVEMFKNGGFLAFQQDSCENLLIAAISVSKKFLQIIEKEGESVRKQVKYGMAVTYGEVMIGIVGHEERMAAISVSDQNNICNYLRSISEKYYSHILITAAAISRIDNFEEKYNFRCIGYLYISSLGQTEKIYDVYDGDSDEDQRLKSQTKEIFENGVNHYCVREFDKARICFIEVLKVFKRDNAAREYLYLCNRHYQNEAFDDKDIYIEVY